MTSTHLIMKLFVSLQITSNIFEVDVATGMLCMLGVAYCTVGNFRVSNFCGLGNSDNFVGLYFCGVPTLIT